MGYYTKYELKYDAINEEIEKELLEIDGLQVNGSVKWYGHERDMIEISRKFPNVLFDLYGRGEEQGDLWHKYFKNGQMQKCPAIITFEECKL